jgi:Tol biopolymer transport system component
MALPKIAGFSLPLVLAAVAAAIGFGVLLAKLTEGDGGDNLAVITATPTRTPGSVGTITAQGEIAYVTSDQRVGLTDPTGAASQVISDFDGVSAVYWSQDGSMLAADIIMGLERVVVIDPTGEVLFEVVGGSEPVWSPVDNRLAIVRSSEIVVVDSAGSELSVIGDAIAPVWSPDGGSIAYLHIGSEGLATPAIIDLVTGEQSELASNIEPAEPIYPIAWRPSGELIAYKDSLYDLTTGESEQLEGVPVSWSPDGRLLIQTLGRTPEGRTTVRLFDFNDELTPIIGLEVIDSVEGDPPWVYVLRWIDWNPDGTRLLYLDPAGPALRYYDTVAVTQDRYRGIEGIDPDFSPDGTHVAFSQQEKLWVFPVDASALVHIVDGIRPEWRPSRAS